MDKHFIIYKTISKITGRYYIGMHVTTKIDDGYLGSGRRIMAEIRKYGRENFERIVLETLPSKEALIEREAQLVTEEIRADPLCLNLKNGGEGGWDHVTSEQQSANGHRGNAAMRVLRETNPEWVAAKAKAISESLKIAYATGLKSPTMPNWAGRKHSPETKAKISAARKRHSKSSGQ